jgi:phosphoribosylaminoimidazolecarboxamide formyltransferase/IMP cyclohydrolase
VARAEVLQGKEISYNNLVDLDAALALACELERPAAVIVKHTNACGAAESPEGVAAAYARARACDPTSAFGGVVALNRPVDEALALLLAETFLECIVAPAFDEKARAELSKKKNLRLLALRDPISRRGPSLELKTLYGGLLAQTGDAQIVSAGDAEVATKRPPTMAELRGLDFAWRVAKHVKSNAIVLARADEHGCVTVGVGAGQMSRVDSVRIAVEKAQSPVAGCVLGSDAFFPFRDGLDAAAKAGVTAVIQPGGSVRDDEVVKAADEHGLAMVLTRMRHFKH